MGDAIGNYKGVMLCNRPYQRSTVAATAAANMSAPKVQPFRAGGRAPLTNELGLSKAVKDAPPRKREFKPTVTQKHKAWLASFTRERNSLQDDMQKEKDRKERRKKDFMAREALMRQQIKGPRSGSKPSSTKQNTSKRPAWAHTEESKAAEDEQLKEEELDQLISFTENLDFDKFLDDEEVQSALILAEQAEKLFKEEKDGLTDESLVDQETGAPSSELDAIPRWKWKARMTEKVDAVTGEPSEDGIDRRDFLINSGVDVLPLPTDRLSLSRQLQQAGTSILSDEALKEWNAKFKQSAQDLSNNQREDDEQSVFSEAARLLSDNKSLGKVHSASSIAAIQTRTQKTARLPAIKEANALETEYAEPVISTVKDNRLAYKKHVNQLPYQNRNPAV